MKTHYYRLTEVENVCGVTRTTIIEFIRREWIVPAKAEPLELDDEDLARLRLIRELREDLGVNDEAIPVILHLLDQLYRFRIQKSA